MVKITAGNAYNESKQSHDIEAHSGSNLTFKGGDTHDKAQMKVRAKITGEENADAVKVMTLGLWVTLVVAVVLVGAGLLMTYLGATGDSDIQMFGANIKTTSVGVAVIVCGAVVAIVSIGTVMKRVKWQ